jgi:hypothetical protein
MSPTRCWLTGEAWFTLARYDLLNALLGFRAMSWQLGMKCATAQPPDPGRVAVISEALNLAACFYVKRVRCLQRSAVLVRLLRKHGIDGQLVIAYRPTPFLAHAWAEVDGGVVGDSAGYPERLRVLHRL